MINFVRRLFRLNWAIKNREDIDYESIAKTPEQEAAERAEKLNSFYGCDEEGNLGIEFSAFQMDEIGWKRADSKKYTLVEISRYKEKVSIWGLISCWRGTGKSEWELWLAYMLVFGLRKAWKEGAETLDITMLFNRNLTTVDKSMSAEEVKNHIIRQFTIVSETDEEVILTLNVA